MNDYNWDSILPFCLQKQQFQLYLNPLRKKNMCGKKFKSQRKNLSVNWREVLRIVCFFYLFVQTVSNGSSRWLVNDTQNIEPRNGPSVFGGLTLRVIEVGRYSHHGICYSLDQQKKRKKERIYFHILTRYFLNRFVLYCSFKLSCSYKFKQVYKHI